MQNRFSNQRGVTAIEYALLLSLVGLLIVSLSGFFQTEVADTFVDVGIAMSDADDDYGCPVGGGGATGPSTASQQADTAAGGGTEGTVDEGSESTSQWQDPDSGVIGDVGDGTIEDGATESWDGGFGG